MIFVIHTKAEAEHTLDEQHHQKRLEYLDELARRGVLVAAGPFDDQDGALFLVRGRAMEDAISVARADPLVEAGLERYEVRGWSDVYDPDRRLGDLIDFEPPSDRSGPLVAPLPDASYEIIDATEDPRYAEFRVRCFANARIDADDPARVGYLGLAAGQRWKKLLLLNDGAMAGQIEIAAPEASALPIRSEALTVIHCLWVLDAYTGLDAGRHLLSAAADAFPDSEGLVTIAYNSALGWLPRAFFEGQGFAVVDQLDTGRFAGDTPIAAYLMWRPFTDDAAPPTWNRDRLRVGVDFCPAYPWMSGKRLYWGDEYAYRVRIVKEGLRRPELLEQMPVLATRRAEPWTLVELGLPACDLQQAIKRVQSALISEPTYYAFFYDVGEGDEMIIVYPYREYRVTKDPSTWRDAVRYGLDKSIPEAELRFSPVPLEDDPGGRALD